MPITPSTCPLDCADACGVEVETDAQRRFVALRGRADHGYSRGHLCGKTAIYGELVTSGERLTRPLVRGAGGLVPCGWDEALDRIAEGLGGLRGEEILCLQYAGNMGLLARRFPMRMMNALGAVTHDAGICDNTATVGHELVLGSAIGADLEALDEADFLVLWGCDAARTLQHSMPRVRELCRRGAPVFAIDIYRSDTIERVEKWGGRGIVVRPGTDAALALLLCRMAFEEGRVDREHLERDCHGAREFEEHVLAGLAAEEAREIVGLSPEDVREFADAFFRAEAPFVKTGVGFARRRNGGMNMRAVCSLAAVLGHAERVHFESGEIFGLDFDRLEGRHLRPSGAPARSVPQVALGRELRAGRYRASVVWGHNPAVTLPDAAAAREGLARDDHFLVVHEQFLTETAALADVVLPAAVFLETSDVFRSYGHRRLHYSRAACEPPGEAKGNVDAFAAVAKRLGLPPETWDVTEDGLCEELFAHNADRLSAEQLAGLRAGEAVRFEPPAGRDTPSGKVELVSERAAALGEPAMATYVPDDWAGTSGDWNLVCAPSVATHNSTFSHSPRHVRRAGPPTVYMHPEDARERGLAEGARVRLRNELATLTLTLGLTDRMPRGMLRVDGMPRAADMPEGVGINALVPGAVSDLGDGNVLYSTRVDLA